MAQYQLTGQSRLPWRSSRLRLATALPNRVPFGCAPTRGMISPALEQLSSFVCNSEPRERTKWYGVYTEEQYQAQRQSEERARWAAGVRTLTGNQSQVNWEGSQLDPPALLSGVTVVIISPRKPVTVGTVARACGSFECEDLRIVMPRQESYITRRHAKSASKGAQYILYRAGHYDSIAEATADCDVRIAFTRWAQASSPHVYKVDISGLSSHPTVQRVVSQPLQTAAAAGGDDASGATFAAAASRPPSAPWSEAAAAAAAAADARLVSPGAAAADAATASSSDPSGEDEEGEDDAQRRRRRGEREQAGFAVPDQGESSSYGKEEAGHVSASVAACASPAQAHQDPSQQHQHQNQQREQRSVAVEYSDGSSGSSSCGGGSAAVGGPVGRPPRVALVFGREELGMSDEEVDSCEVCCSIPIGRLQESLSLSHAVSIALCGLYQARLEHLAASGSAGGTGDAAVSSQPGVDGPAVAAAVAAAGEGTDGPLYAVDASTGAVRAESSVAAV